MNVPFTSFTLSSFTKKKAQGIPRSLLWVWLSGFFFIGISFYSTQRLSYSIHDQFQNPKLSGSFNDPSITIFTAPRPFNGLIGERQRLAVRSWLGLSPNLTVVIFSQDSSVFAFAATFASRVLVEPNIDFTFLGTPFFHSMVARSQVSSSEISVLIHPEILLFPDFISTVKFAHRLDHDWFLFASSQDTFDFTFYLDADGKHWLANDGKKITEQKLQEFLDQRLNHDFCGTEMLMVWNNGDLPLHNGVLPPFLYGKGLHNRWIIAEAVSSKYRFVFDATQTISNIYVNGLQKISDNEKRTWEFTGNRRLGTLYGSFHFHERKIFDSYKLIKCGRRYFFLNDAQKIAYMLEGKILNCINIRKQVEETRNCYMKEQIKQSESVFLSLSLEFLLESRADVNKSVVLAIAGYNYKDMLMSWVCRQRNLKISNFLVCAIDDDVYEFCVLQGIPVFKYSNVSVSISFDDCHFGTECFQNVTKVKSRVVLDILKLGYNVLLSDIDIYWFKNPLPLLSSFGPAVLVAQSDEYKRMGPINLPRRLNSGFYFASSDTQTIMAFHKVVKHAANSNLSEQPSFYDTLCGEGGSNRIGDDRCIEPETNLTVHFLDRDLFPNGAYKGLWEDNDVKYHCIKKGCFILHNNWLSGRVKKLQRQISSHLWEYDISSRMCIQKWHTTKTMSYF